MNFDPYGLVAATLFVSVAAIQNFFLHKSLAKTFEERSRKALAAGKSAPNDKLIKVAMLPGLILFAYVGYFYLGPILAKAMRAN